MSSRSTLLTRNCQWIAVKFMLRVVPPPKHAHTPRQTSLFGGDGINFPRPLTITLWVSNVALEHIKTYEKR